MHILFQIQIHVTLSPTHINAKFLLNKLRLVGLFDLLLQLKSFVIDKIPEDTEQGTYIFYCTYMYICYNMPAHILCFLWFLCKPIQEPLLFFMA